MEIDSFRMLRMSDTLNETTIDGDEVAAESDEPPDDCRVNTRNIMDTAFAGPYAKTKTISSDGKKESLLTRALMTSPDHSEPSYRTFTLGDWRRTCTSSARSNISTASTAELTSDGEVTSPPRSTTPSPPPPSQYNRLPNVDAAGRRKPMISFADMNETEVEANLGRKRCITFACAGKPDQTQSDTTKDRKSEEPPKRKTMLTFACPSRPHDTRKNELPALQHRSSSISARGNRHSTTETQKSCSQPSISSQHIKAYRKDIPEGTERAPRMNGLGDFELSDATRFHEFGSSMEDEDWVNQVPAYKQKLTLSDCMQKENAIRKLGEEAEAEAQEDEDAENNDDDDDNDDDGDDDDDEDDDDDDDDDGDEDTTTINDHPSDDGNESDNEAGFASSDDESDGSNYAFWKPSAAVARTPQDKIYAVSPTHRRESNFSATSAKALEIGSPNSTPLARRINPPPKSKKIRSRTPSLPDSTDFVCGTLDEDRSVEAEYINCLEERRRLKHVSVPQDIDPSFPTSDPDDDDDDDDDVEETVKVKSKSKSRQPEIAAREENGRGRSRRRSGQKTTPHTSPRRLHQSPAPIRRLFGNSPRRLRSPPPPGKLRSPPPTRRPSVAVGPIIQPAGINITGLAQRRPNRARTSSVPRTPNPFFARLDQFYRLGKTSAAKSLARSASFSHDVHARGPIDIVAGLEKKRQKRKEKFWRQHCRKAAKEQQERRPIPGKGAERMKELGLEAAERFRAYGIGQEVQLVLSI